MPTTLNNKGGSKWTKILYHILHRDANITWFSRRNIVDKIPTLHYNGYEYDGLLCRVGENLYPFPTTKQLNAQTNKVVIFMHIIKMEKSILTRI